MNNRTKAEKVIAIQCGLLSQRGGGLPSAVLPVASRLNDSKLLITNEAPENPQTTETLTLSKAKTAIFGARILENKKADLVHTHGLWTGLSLAAIRWKRHNGGPTIVSPHGMLDPWAMNQGVIKRMKKAMAMFLVEREHLNGADIVHALNRAEHDAIRAAGITSPIATIPNGTETEPIHPPKAPDWMKKSTLLFLGRLHEKKGIAELIDAWNLSHGSLPGWQLALAGWDDGPNEFRGRAARSDAPIIFPGPLYGEEKAAAYAHCAAFILPSKSEGLPMTVLEAWAYGKPVLMTDACNLPEGFEAAAAERIATDAGDMAKVLIKSLRNHDFISEAGNAGKKLVERRFSWKAVSDDWQMLYAFALKKGVRPSFLADFNERAAIYLASEML